MSDAPDDRETSCAAKQNVRGAERVTTTDENEDVIKVLEGKVEALELVLRYLLQLVPWPGETADLLARALMIQSNDISDEYAPNEIPTHKLVACARLLSFVQHLVDDNN